MARDPICGRCRYDLSGLSSAGTCPECGQAYDMATGRGLVAAFSSRQAALDQKIARLRTIGLIACGVLVMGCGGVAAIFHHQPLRPVMVAGIVASIFAMAAFTSYRYER